MNIDPKLAFVPNFFINFTIKRVLYIMSGKIGNKELYEEFYKKG